MNTSTRIITAIALILLGAIGRIALADAPNIEPVMALTILAAALLGGRYSMIVGVASIVLSDLAIGTHSVMWSTWTAWAIIGASAVWINRTSIKERTWKLVGASTAHGIASALFFYAWTNAGVWLEGRLYAPSLNGLIASYVAGLPFLRLHLVSTLVLVPTVIGMAHVVMQRSAQRTTITPQQAPHRA